MTIKQLSARPIRFAGAQLGPDSRLRSGMRRITLAIPRHPLGTGFGSTVGAAVVGAAAGSVGIGAIGLFTSVATGLVVGGWAGHRISESRLKPINPDLLRRRSRTIRLLKVARTLRRRQAANR